MYFIHSVVVASYLQNGLCFFRMEEVTEGYDSPDGGKRRSPDLNAPIYGELIVLG